MQRFQFLDDECRRPTLPDAMMRALLSALTRVFSGAAASNPKIACFHCGELVRQKGVVHVMFDGVSRDVCCHGCAAILSTVEQLGQCTPYLAQKQQLEMPDA